MAMIKCPECGNEISDKAIKCPKCGYPMKQEEIKTVQQEETEEKSDSSKEIVTEENSKKKNGKKVGICVGAILLLSVASIGMLKLKKTDQSFTVNEMTLSKWKLTDSNPYLDYYKGYITSDQTKPFIAVIGNYEEKDSDPDYYVYMEDGKGEFDAIQLADDDPSIKYLPIGYLWGNSVSDSDINKVSYDDKDYNDYSSETSCTIDIDIEMKQKENGLLFAQVENDLNKEIKKNVKINIVDGKGEYSCSMDNLPLKSRGVTAKLVPQLFCEAKTVKDGDYTVEEPFDIEKDENDDYITYDGKEEISFKDYENGLVLYTEKLIDGGKKEDRDKVYNKISVIDKNKCEIGTHVFANKKDKILMPSYEINKIGCIKIEKYINSKKETN